MIAAIVLSWTLCWAWNPAYLEAFPDTDPIAGCIDPSSPRSPLVTEYEGKVRINDYWSSDAHWTQLTVNGTVIHSPMTGVWYPLPIVETLPEPETIAPLAPTFTEPVRNVKKLYEKRYGNRINLID